MSFITAYEENSKARDAKRIRGEQEELEAEQIEFQQVVRREQASRARKQQIREARAQQAAIQNVAGASGTSGSSAPMTAGYNLASQARNNIQEIQESLGRGAITAGFQKRGSRLQTKMAESQQSSGVGVWGPALADLAMMGMTGA